MEKNNQEFLHSSQTYFNLYFNLLNEEEKMFVAVGCIIPSRGGKKDGGGVAGFRVIRSDFAVSP